MKSNNTSVYVSNSRAALKVYGFGATILYGLALTYCIITGKYFEAGLVGAMMVVLGTLAVTVFNSFGKEAARDNDYDSFNQAA